MSGKRRGETRKAATTRTTRWTPFGRRPRKNRPKTWKTRLLTVVKWASVTGLVLALLAVAGFVYLYKTTDIPDPNKDFLTETSKVFYDGGQQELGSFAVQNRESIDFDQMPQDMRDAVVAAENKTFWTDSGISIRGTLRAAFSNAQGNNVQGGSTITQQYVKILYLNQERSYTRKIKEAILSLKIQKELSKQQVLAGYLNTIYFGRGAYGVQAAAQAWFGVDAKDLDLKQAAVLAAVINNPTGLDPDNGNAEKRALKDRYRYVLGQMVGLDAYGNGNTKGIDQTRADKAMKRLPDIKTYRPENVNGGQTGFMLSMVRSALLQTKDVDGNFFTDDQIDGGGLQITTTFTKKAMDAAQSGVEQERPEGFGDKQLHVAAASVEPGTGAVRGFYAGQDYLQSEINWAIAGGQAGSTFKPFALAAGLKAGYSLKDTFDGNQPLDIGGGTLIHNEGDTSYGTVNLITAIEKSINTAFVDLTQSMPNGPQSVIDTAEAMGIPPVKAPKKKGAGWGFPDKTPGLDPVPTVTLGSQTVSPINMADAYATMANGGVAAHPFIIEKVTDSHGTVLYQHQVDTQRAIPADINADVSYTLQQNVQVGTGAAALSLGRPAAGKTGTATNDANDVTSAWFAGYTPQLATAVMYVRGDGVGRLDGWLPSYFGSDYPTRTWTAIMAKDMEGLDPETFPPPAYVDGTAPQSGHTYVPPPPPTKPTRKPSNSPSGNTPTSPPTSSAPPTSAPPTSAPPTSTPPTSSAPPTPPVPSPTSTSSPNAPKPSPGSPPGLTDESRRQRVSAGH